MAGRKVFDFIKLSTKIPQSVRGEFGALRSKFESSHATMSALPSNLEAIDWGYYAGRVGNPALVEDFKAKYGSVQVPRPSDNQTSGIGALENDFKKEVAEYLEGSKERIAKFEAALADLNAEKPLEEMTVAEYLSTKPELRAQLVEDIEARKL